MLPFKKRNLFFIGAFQGVLGILANGAIALLLWYGGKLLNEKAISVGVITCKFHCKFCEM